MKESLSDEPLSFIKSMAVTEQNFPLAWKKLVDQYDNNKLIIYAHVNLILSAKPVLKESAAAYKQLWNETVDNVVALKALGSPTEHWDHLMVPIILNRLDNVTKRSWEENKSLSADPSTFEEIKEFLREKIVTLESICPASVSGITQETDNFSNKSNNKTNNKSNSVKSFNLTKPSVTSTCLFCSAKDHRIYSCNDFIRKTVQERRDFIRINQLCYNCLEKGHIIKECKNTKNCFICNERHHILVHQDESSSSKTGPSAQSKSVGLPPPSTIDAENSTHPNESSINETIHAVGIKRGITALLGTAMVAVESLNGRRTFARALIDSRSEVTCIAESLVQRLKLSCTQLSIPINGVGEQQSYTSCTNFYLSSRTDNRNIYSIDAYILKKPLSYVPRVEDKLSDWFHFKDLKLADPQYYSNTPVELILGADIYAVIVQEGTISGSANTTVAQRTRLGWILTLWND